MDAFINNTVAPNPAKEIALWVGRLSDSIARTGDLTSKLNPLINPSTGGCASPDTSVPPLCELAGQLRTLDSRLRDVIDYLERVEL